MHRQNSTVTRKGQVTVPLEIRRALGIQVGDKVSFVLEGGAARIERRESVTDRTAGIFRSSQPALSAEELRAVAEEVIVDEVQQRSQE